MILDQPYLCDECGAQKREVNHWWLVFVVTTPNGASVIELQAWQPALAPLADAIHLCGADCVQRRVSKLMSAYSRKESDADRSPEIV